MRRAISSIAIVAALACMLPGAAALAAPGLPELFWGTASGNVGDEIDAIVDDEVVASTTLGGGTYGAAPGLLLVPDPEGDNAGRAITFEIGGQEAQERASFANGAITELDLTLEPSAVHPVPKFPPVLSTEDAAPVPPAPAHAKLSKSFDLTGDGKVGLDDLALLMSRWGLAALAEPADLNGDGAVNLYDFNALIFRL